MMILLKELQGGLSEVAAAHQARWLLFTQVAREVTEAMVPAYRTKGSKHVFTQPQLLTLLCLMRHQRWSYREIENWLAEHRELREDLGLQHVPDHTTLYRFQKRLSEDFPRRVLTDILNRLSARNQERCSNGSSEHLR